MALGYSWETQHLSPMQGFPQGFIPLRVPGQHWGSVGTKGTQGGMPLSQKNKHLGKPKQISLKTSIWEWKQYGNNFKKKKSLLFLEDVGDFLL